MAHSRSCTVIPALGFLVFQLSAALVAAEGEVEGFRSKVEKWVETRQITSEERSKWIVEQETLRATRDLLKQQKKALSAEVAELESTNTQSDDERRDLLLERGEFQRSSRVLEGKIRTLEEQVLAIVPRLPQPLQNKLEPLLVQIPDDPEVTKVALGQRLMNVLGVLAQAEKFNGTANFVGETREVASGKRVSVRTLYWGLGQAVYVDSQGELAGIGRPGPNGWEFTDDPDLVEEAERILDIYEGKTDAIEFVKLPVAIETSVLSSAVAKP